VQDSFGTSEDGNEPVGFIKGGEFLVGKPSVPIKGGKFLDLLFPPDSLEGFCSMALVS
jgi:hypothetical protein